MNVETIVVFGRIVEVTIEEVLPGINGKIIPAFTVVEGVTVEVEETPVV